MLDKRSWSHINGMVICCLMVYGIVRLGWLSLTSLVWMIKIIVGMVVEFGVVGECNVCFGCNKLVAVVGIVRFASSVCHNVVILVTEILHVHFELNLDWQIVRFLNVLHTFITKKFTVNSFERVDFEHVNNIDWHPQDKHVHYMHFDRLFQSN